MNPSSPRPSCRNVATACRPPPTWSDSPENPFFGCRAPTKIRIRLFSPWPIRLILENHGRSIFSGYKSCRPTLGLSDASALTHAGPPPSSTRCEALFVTIRKYFELKNAARYQLEDIQAFRFLCLSPTSTTKGPQETLSCRQHEQQIRCHGHGPSWRRQGMSVRTLLKHHAPEP